MSPEDQLVAQRQTILSNAIIRANPGVSDHAAQQLTELWREDFAISQDRAGRYELLSKTGERPAELIKARLASPDYAHFNPPTPAQAPAPAQAVEPALVTIMKAGAGTGIFTDHHGNPIGRAPAGGPMGFGRPVLPIDPRPVG